MAGKRARLGVLHEKFTDLLISELDQYAAEGIPLAAADKSVIVAFLKANDITADADSDSMQGLREAFSEDMEKRRAARVAVLQATKDDIVQGFLN